jgi:restriction system protein
MKEISPEPAICNAQAVPLTVTPRDIVLTPGLAVCETVAFAPEIIVTSPPKLSLLLQATVEREAKTIEGDLILAVAPVWKAIVAMLANDPELAFRIPPDKWEEIIAGAYQQAGFDEVTLTPRSGDYGRDVIAVKKGYWSVRIIDQVKAFGPSHRVLANDVRALLGVLQADRNATKGLVTTTSDFAPKIAIDPSIAPFVPHRLELVNGKELVRRLTDIADGLFKV